MVEAVRVGYITAKDQKSYQKWSRRFTASKGAVLKGAALEHAVNRIAGLFPDNVIRVPA